ncbi:MAG: redoxin domain-containing protein [Pirellulales bacterium]|nr:redoxin domain-containing protein [Pirellulales bacterium]
MKNRWRSIGELAAIVGVTLCAIGRLAIASDQLPRSASTSAEDTPDAQLIADFALRDYRGRKWALSELADHRLVVVVFLSTDCPLAKLYASRLNQLAEQYGPRGVAFLGIDSNRQDSLTEILHFARVHGIEFPVLKDVGNRVADQFAAERTPEAFVLDSERRVRYRGRIDDQFDIGVQRAVAQHQDLQCALDTLLAGGQLAAPRTTAPGCRIGRVLAQTTTAEAPITWSEQIASIFQRHCQDCHRPGQIAPFPFLTYSDVQGWEAMIREVVEQERMPPWGADPHYGEFVNDVRLSDAEKRLIFDWIEQGAPEGDPARAPPPMEFASGWHIAAQPDQIVFISERPFTVPATGPVEYQWFEVDPGFTEDKWVKAAEARPDNRAVVHHVTVYYKPPGASTYNLNLRKRINLLTGFAPGKTAVNAPDAGIAFYLPAGTKLLFELHYTSTGKVEQDRSSVGLLFAKREEVHKQVNCVLVANDEFAIPPHDPDYEVKSEYTVDEDSLLISLSPHMHLRGKSFRYEALYPGGLRETLLSVPRFDFNWQHNYQFRDWKLLPKGTRILCNARFDNSPDNLANPDPNATVRWGDQTWEEMMIGSIAIAPAHQDIAGGIGVPPRLVDPSLGLRRFPTWGWLVLAAIGVALAGGSIGLAWRQLGHRAASAAAA